MYIWRKSVDQRYLRSRGKDLEERFETRFALVERAGRNRASLEISCRTMKQAQALRRELGGAVVRLRSNWLEQFARKARGKPLRVGSRLVILRSPLKTGTSNARVSRVSSIIIPAEAAFGTGDHATTAMCLRLLEQITRRFEPGWRMLDAGTGSGILAIAGSYFGATRVLAIDNDPLACATAKRNATVNGASHITFSTGDILKRQLAGKFDVITANLYSEILIAALPLWSRQLAPNGHLILSGILRSQETMVTRALRQHGFITLEIRRRGKWVAVHAQD